MSITDITELGRRWAAAEVQGDTDTLDELAVDDFTLVGPLGFVLDRKQWLDRYRSGQFVTTELNWHDVTVRDYGDCAVVIGIQEQRAAYQGRPSDGKFRVTQILVRTDGRWRLAGIHLSPIAPPPGAPTSAS
jgi:ketosteroid isomerase-like protein